MATPAYTKQVTIRNNSNSNYNVQFTCQRSTSQCSSPYTLNSGNTQSFKFTTSCGSSCQDVNPINSVMLTPILSSSCPKDTKKTSIINTSSTIITFCPTSISDYSVTIASDGTITSSIQ